MAKKIRKTQKTRTFEGLPVIDADSSLAINITPADIKSAGKKNPSNCAAARACARTLHTEARVFLTRTYIKKKDKWVRFLTPMSAQKEIIAFDRGSAFEPGEYKFTAPAPTQRLGVYRHQGSKKTNRTASKRHFTVNIRDKSQYDSKKEKRA